MIPGAAAKAAVCVSSFHRPALLATVHGLYINGQEVWYCEPCAAMGESVGMFKRDDTP